MAGSGNGGSRYTHRDVYELLRQARDEEKWAEYTREVNRYLQSVLQELNSRDVQGIRRHLEAIKTALQSEIDGTLTLVFGGSTAKHTYANGISDVDMLVRLNNSSLSNAQPRDVLEYFAERLKQRFPQTTISIGNLAITVTYSDGHEIQLLPCLKTATGIKIAQPGTNEWSSVIHPERFAEKLTEVNSRCANKVVPIIKLFKAINDSLPSASQLSGYHIESLAINAFKNYSGPTNWHEMLKHLCQYSSSAVLSPIHDRTGQCLHVDDYLGSANSRDRVRVSKALARLVHKIEGIDARMASDEWRDLI